MHLALECVRFSIFFVEFVDAIFDFHNPSHSNVSKIITTTLIEIPNNIRAKLKMYFYLFLGCQPVVFESVLE